LLTIPATFGHFYPWGGSRLAFSTDNRGPTAKLLARLPFVRIEQDADDGYTLSFEAEHFGEIAEIARPKRRRQMTPEQRQANIDRLAKFQFSAARTAAGTPQIPARSA
jgi:hypothetical protein